MPTVRSALATDAARCVEIVSGLPDWFSADVASALPDALRRGGGWVACEPSDRVVGFLVVERRSAAVAEILWTAVDAAERGRGIGTELLGGALAGLAADGVRLVEVKTLDRTAGYAPYEATLAFWERRGFVQIDSIDPLPGWQPGNPCAIHVAALSPTRTAERALNSISADPLEPRVLVIGLNPRRVPGPWDPEPIARAIEAGMQKFTDHGIGAQASLFGLDGHDDPEEMVAAALRSRTWECVVIGGGVRTDAEHLDRFEAIINLVRELAPGAAIAFSATASDTYEAAVRRLDQRR